MRKYSPFGYLLGLVFGGAKEAIEEQSAKRELEQKLGRKVSKEELYSLGSHLDATGANDISQPLKITARESDMPFADAKPPMKRSAFFLIIFLIVGGVCLFFLPVIIKMMPEQSLYRLNPFSSKPPEGAFPEQVGEYQLVDSYSWFKAGGIYDFCERFEAEYTDGKTRITHKIWNCKTEEELQKTFEGMKKSNLSGYSYQVVDNSDSRYEADAPQNRSTRLLFKQGLQLKMIEGVWQKSVNEFEGILKNAPPVEEVKVNYITPTPSTSSSTGTSVSVVQLLDAYKNSPTEADKKYKGKIITVSGTVEVAEKDKNGNPMLGFMRPGSTKPTEGMVVCGFDKSQEAKVSKIKKSDSVKVSCKVTMGLVGSVVLENCSTL